MDPMFCTALCPCAYIGLGIVGEATSHVTFDQWPGKKHHPSIVLQGTAKITLKIPHAHGSKDGAKAREMLNHHLWRPYSCAKMTMSVILEVSRSLKLLCKEMVTVWTKDCASISWGWWAVNYLFKGEYLELRDACRPWLHPTTHPSVSKRDLAKEVP